MKFNHRIINYLHFIVFCFIFNVGFCAKFISVNKAIEKNLLTADIAGKGGYTGGCFEMTIKNLTYDTLPLYIEAGCKLIAGDSVYQNILVTHSDSFIIAGGGSCKRDMYGMCMEMTDRAPQAGTKFRLGKMADSLLVILARFIDKHKLFTRQEAQHAVWVLSNGNPLESIHTDGKDAVIGMLQMLMSRLTGKPIPWYTLEYAKDTARLFSGNAIRLTGVFDYYMPNNAPATLGIYDERGKAVHMLFVEQPHNPGEQQQVFVLDVSKWLKGKYFARLFSEGRLVVQKEINL